MKQMGMAADDRVIFDFSDRKSTEAIGGCYSEEYGLSGKGTCVFDGAHPFPAALTEIDGDWSRHQYVQISVYSEEATGHRIDFFILSDNPDTPILDGYYKEQTVTWKGWKILTFSFGGCGRGNPLGTDHMTGLAFRFRPLSADDPTRLFFDRVWITNHPTADLLPPPDDSQDFIVKSRYQMGMQPDYVQMMQAQHPRLILSSNDFLRLREASRTVPLIQKAQEAVLMQADDILSLPPTGYQKSDGWRLDRVDVSRLIPLALAYKLSDCAQYKRRLWKELEQICHYPDWNPVHDIDVGDYARPVALVYDWLYYDFSPEERRVIRNSMMRNAILPMISHFRDKTGFAVDEYNHNSVTSSGIGMAALAMGDEPGYAPICNEVIHETIEACRLPLRHFAPNGACFEGVHYWTYGWRATCQYIAAIITSLGDDCGFKKMPGLSNTGYFIPAMHGESGKPFNFGDCGESASIPPELLFFAKLYHDPMLAAYFIKMQEKYFNPQEAVYTLLYFEKMPEMSTCTLPFDFIFHGLVPVASMRSSYNDPTGVFLAFKGGNTQSHGDQDRGSFVLDALGERWILDLGSENYDVPGMFNITETGGRWTYYKKRAEGSNTLIVNPFEEQNETTADQDVYACSPITSFVSNESCAYGIVDLTDAYSPVVTHTHIEKVERGFALIDQRSIAVIQDEIISKEPFELYAFMHTRARITIAADKRSAVMEQNGKQLKVTLYGSPAAFFEIMDAKTLQEKYKDRANGTPEDVHKLCVHVKDETKVTITVVFEPVSLQKQPFREYAPIPLEQWHRYAE